MSVEMMCLYGAMALALVHPTAASCAIARCVLRPCKGWNLAAPEMFESATLGMSHRRPEIFRARLNRAEPCMNKQSAIGIALGVLGTILAATGLWLIFVYAGAYNVAASEEHGDVVRWSLDKTMHRSVANRATPIELPRNPSQALLAEGAGHYAGSCVHCHGAPGQEPSDWSRGMRPRPPHLVEAAKHWDPREIHWIVTNGIKMTGMPAFGSHHTPEQLLALTAFVNALPGLSADDYAGLTASAPESGGHQAPEAGSSIGKPKGEFR